ncbi:MAG: GTPase [Planctomycetota bacterium]
MSGGRESLRVPQFRVLTASGRAGVQVVEVRGLDRLALLARFLRTPSGDRVEGERLKGRGPVRLDLFDGDTLLDEVLFVDFAERGRSELHLHGAPVILRRLERSWQRREDARSTDLFLDLLTRAQTEAQLALAIEQSGFGPDDWRADLEAGGRTGREALAAALRAAEALFTPFDLALVGRQNAGKSTLFNRLLMLERNLTGPTPGLTRDAIREVVDLGGYPIRLVDTAGLGAVQDSIDALAQERTIRIGARTAHVLVVASDEGFGPADFERHAGALLTVRSKSDLAQVGEWPADEELVSLDALHRTGSSGVRARFAGALRLARGLPEVSDRGVGLALPKTREAIAECRCKLAP